MAAVETVVDAIVQEFEQESATTRRLLKRVPADQLTWKPHPKSMSLGQLAMHIAQGPGFLIGWAAADSTEVPDLDGPTEATTVEQILTSHDRGVETVKKTLGRLGESGLQGMCKVTKGGATLLEMPKKGLVRTLVLNHLVHHRGQLSVYLRLLNVPVPSIYGPSADENPFAPK
ncbi:MAG: DinB family protein [Vicinamibacterales bacterium]